MEWTINPVNPETRHEEERTMDLHENGHIPIFSPVEVLRPTTRNTHIETATRYVEEHFFGDKATFARQAFDYINDRFFHGQLPWTLIIWGLTAHGHCLGQTHADLNAPPLITLHPSLLGGKEKVNPWGIPSRLLGHCYAFDVVLHECMHVSVLYLLGGQRGGDSSHNCPAWVAEVNRIAPMLGFPDVKAEMTKVARVKEASGSAIQRVNKGNIELKEFARFPHGVRSHYQDFSFYEKRILPWE
jgi:hypothetical protein